MADESMKNFEKRIHRSMKTSGMLFPNTDEEVKSFESNFNSISGLTQPNVSVSQLFDVINRRSAEPLVKLAAFKAKTKPEDKSK